jgi:hypothetical protein
LGEPSGETPVESPSWLREIKAFIRKIESEMAHQTQTGFFLGEGLFCAGSRVALAERWLR